MAKTVNSFIAYLSTAALKDETRTVITFAHICENTGNLYASDGFRLHYFEKDRYPDFYPSVMVLPNSSETIDLYKPPNPVQIFENASQIRENNYGFYFDKQEMGYLIGFLKGKKGVVRVHTEPEKHRIVFEQEGLMYSKTFEHGEQEFPTFSMRFDPELFNDAIWKRSNGIMIQFGDNEAIFTHTHFGGQAIVMKKGRD